jgi:hypothetical protein
MKSNKTTPPAASLLALCSQTSLYRVQVLGDGLFPRYRDGDFAIIRPIVAARPEEIAPGSILLVALKMPGVPGSFQQVGLWKLSGDLDLVCGSALVEHGDYLILGIAETDLL